MKPISDKEVIDELQRLSQKNDKGLTTDEWVDVMGKSLQSTRLMLQKANKLGWLVRGKRTSEAINGRIFQADVYRIVRPDVKKGSRRG